MFSAVINVGNSFVNGLVIATINKVNLQECAKQSSRQRLATLKNLKCKKFVEHFWLLHDSICVIS